MLESLMLYLKGMGIRMLQTCWLLLHTTKRFTLKAWGYACSKLSGFSCTPTKP